MQTQDAPAEIIFKFWPWFEANRKRLVYAGVAVLALFVIWMFVTSQQKQNLIAAGQAYTQFQLNQPQNPTMKQVADGYLQIATKYSGTTAAQRAQLQAGAILFNGASYADAQKVFENFVASESGSQLVVFARLGIGACLEAQNKPDEALAAYRAAANLSPNYPEAISAKASQARILDTQGKLNEALSLYQEVARSPFGGSLASEAGQRIAVIQGKLAMAKPATK